MILRGYNLLWLLIWILFSIGLSGLLSYMLCAVLSKEEYGFSIELFVPIFIFIVLTMNLSIPLWVLIFSKRKSGRRKSSFCDRC